MVYSEGLIKNIEKIIKHEGYATFYAGAYPFFLKTFIYGLSTLYLCDLMTDSIKNK